MLVVIRQDLGDVGLLDANDKRQPGGRTAEALFAFQKIVRQHHPDRRAAEVLNAPGDDALLIVQWGGQDNPIIP
ncbi:MAG: hypothetical protein M1299_02940 [Firmicutes bacterium]|nr:hypothetical protein [Bacillota bacterium]